MLKFWCCPRQDIATSTWVASLVTVVRKPFDHRVAHPVAKEVAVSELWEPAGHYQAVANQDILKWEVFIKVCERLQQGAMVSCHGMCPGKCPRGLSLHFAWQDNGMLVRCDGTAAPHFPDFKPSRYIQQFN